MAAGWLAAGQCWSTQLDAAKALCSQPIAPPASNVSQYCTWASTSGVNASLTISQYALNNSANPTSRTLSIPLQGCDTDNSPTLGLSPLSFSLADASQIVLACTALWATAWCMKALRRVLSAGDVSES